MDMYTAIHFKHAFDVSTAIYDSVALVTSGRLTPPGLDFKADGTKMYIVD